MKKIIVILSIFLTLLSTTSIASANTATTSIGGNTQFNVGTKFTVTFAINPSVPLGGFSGRVQFDSSMIRIDSYKGLNGVNINSFNTSTGSFNTNSQIRNNTTFLEITFTPTNAFTVNRTTTVRLTDIIGANVTGTARVTGSASSRTFTAIVPKSTNNNLSGLSVNGTSVSGFNANTTTYNLANTDDATINIVATRADNKASVSGAGTRNLDYGANTLRVVVTAENGATKTYTINIERNDYRSNDNSLKSLTISDGLLVFDPIRNNYTVIVDHEVDEITLNAEVNDSKATINQSTITKELDVYSNEFSFVVTAENQTKRTVKVTVVRRDETGYAGELSSNNYLSDLEIIDYDLFFDKEVLEYELFVNHTVKSIEILAIVDDETATLLKPTDTNLQLGLNEFDLLMIAQDESERLYKVRVYRQENLNPLSQQELIERLSDVEANYFNLKLKRYEDIAPSFIQTIQVENKGLHIHIVDEVDQVIGIWQFAANQLNLVNTLTKSMVDLKQVPTELKSLLNYANSKVISLAHQGDFGESITMSIVVDNQFNESDPLYLYYYNQEKNRLELVDTEVILENGLATFSIDHASIYVLSPAVFYPSTLMIDNITYVLIIMAVSIVFLFMMVISMSVRLSKLKKRLRQ